MCVENTSEELAPGVKGEVVRVQCLVDDSAHLFSYVLHLLFQQFISLTEGFVFL